MFVFGKHVNPGVQGVNPNLAATSNNIIPSKQYDYRQVFSTLMQDWLGAGPSALGAANLASFAQNKLPLVTQTEIVPATCYASAFDVGLTHFDAVLETDGRVRVNWQTSTETNNDYFEVQQSADGAVYRTVERVSGAGTTDQRQTYLAFDPNPVPGINYYRLKQVDLDGRFEFFDPVTVMVIESSDLAIDVSRFPNPASDMIYVNITASHEAKANIQLMTIGGKQVLNDSFEMLPGLNQRTLPVKNLRAGLYYIHISTGKPGSYEYKKLATIKQIIE